LSALWSIDITVKKARTSKQKQNQSDQSEMTTLTKQA